MINKREYNIKYSKGGLLEKSLLKVWFVYFLAHQNCAYWSVLYINAM